MIVPAALTVGSGCGLAIITQSPAKKGRGPAENPPDGTVQFQTDRPKLIGCGQQA
jgi:hypothetical protein